MKTAHALFLIAVAAAGPGLAAGQDTAPDAVCIVNGSATPHVFVAEARGGERRVETLAPGARLCAGGAGEEGGVVSVFEDAASFEGCSRLVAPGRTEVLEKYVDFDRCFWGSNS